MCYFVLRFALTGMLRSWKTSLGRVGSDHSVASFSSVGSVGRPTLCSCLCFSVCSLCAVCVQSVCSLCAVCVQSVCSLCAVCASLCFSVWLSVPSLCFLHIHGHEFTQGPARHQPGVIPQLSCQSGFKVDLKRRSGKFPHLSRRNFFLAKLRKNSFFALRRPNYNIAGLASAA